jgi:hypothetical protein
MKPDPKHPCPVCGWPKLDEPPRSATGSASFEICPCCGFQFGVTDDDEGINEAAWRAQWIAGGMQWSSTSRPAPTRWSASRQLTKAGLD